MSVTSASRSDRTALAQSGAAQPRRAQRPAGPAAKGYRVIRPALPVAAAPEAGLAARLWQRLCAALRVTPEQWAAHQLVRQTHLDVGQRVVVLSGGQPVLMTPPVPATTGRRAAQPDLA